jgi:hypothetical protein
MLAKPAAGHGLSKEKFDVFGAFGYTGSSALTWQEAIDFTGHSPAAKSLVCDALRTGFRCRSTGYAGGGSLRRQRTGGRSFPLVPPIV